MNMKVIGKKLFVFVFAVAAALPARADYLASDNAAEAAYGGGWTNGSNGGFGWNGAWSLTASGPSAGMFMGTSTNNGFGGGIGIDSTNNQAWGLWANTGNSATAFRSFPGALTNGQTFVIDIDNGFIETNGSVGFTLTGYGDPGASSQFSFLFRGGDTNYVITLGKMYWYAETNTGVPFTSVGLHVAVTFGAGATYACAITPMGGSTTVISGVDPGGAGNLDHVEMFNNNAGPASDHDAFFNNISLFPRPSITDLTLTGGTNATISFLPNPVLRHSLQACDNLMTTNWLPVVSNLTGNGLAVLQAQDPGASGQTNRYYRIKAIP